MMKMFWLFFNQFNQSATFRTNGSKKPITIFGTIVGFIIVIGWIVATSFFISNFFLLSSITINSYTDNQIVPEMDLSNFKLGFYILDGANRKIPDLDRLITTTGVLWDYEIPKVSDFDRNVTIPKINCGNYENGSLLYKEFSTFPDLICFDLPSLKRNHHGVYGSKGK